MSMKNINEYINNINEGTQNFRIKDFYENDKTIENNFLKLNEFDFNKNTTDGTKDSFGFPLEKWDIIAVPSPLHDVKRPGYMALAFYIGNKGANVIYQLMTYKHSFFDKKSDLSKYPEITQGECKCYNVIKVNIDIEKLK